MKKPVPKTIDEAWELFSTTAKTLGTNNPYWVDEEDSIVEVLKSDEVLEENEEDKIKECDNILFDLLPFWENERKVIPLEIAKFYVLKAKNEKIQNQTNRN